MYLFLLSLKFIAFGINCYMLIWICIHIYFPKLLFFSLYGVIWMYLFRVNHLVLKSHLVCFSQMEIISPAVSVTWLFTLSCVCWNPPDTHPTLSTWLYLPLLSLFGSCYNNYVGEALLMLLLGFVGDSVSQKMPCTSVSYHLGLPFLPWSLSQRSRNYFVDVFTGTGFHNFAFVVMVILYNSLCLLKTEVSLMRAKGYSVCGI